MTRERGGMGVVMAAYDRTRGATTRYRPETFRKGAIVARPGTRTAPHLAAPHKVDLRGIALTDRKQAYYQIDLDMVLHR